MRRAEQWLNEKNIAQGRGLQRRAGPTEEGGAKGGA